MELTQTPLGTPLDKVRRSGEGRGTRKLKTYSAKKRLSGGRTTMTVDSEDDAPPQTQSPATKSSPDVPNTETHQQTTTSSSKPRRAKRRTVAQSPDLGSTATAAAATTTGTAGLAQSTPLDQVDGLLSTPLDALDATQSSPVRPGQGDTQESALDRKTNPRDRISRNRAFLDSIRKPNARKAQPLSQDHTADRVTDNEPSSNPSQISDSQKVSAWLSHGSKDAKVASKTAADTDAASEDQEESEDPEDPEAAEPHNNGYGALLDKVDGGAHDDAEEDVEHHLPSDSDDDAYQPEPAQPTKTNTKTSVKRKRLPSDQASPPPAKKRQKKPVSAATNTTRHAAAAAAQPSTSNPSDFPSQGNFTAAEIALVEGAFDDARLALGNITRSEMIHKIQTSSSDVNYMLTTLNQDILPKRNRKAIQRFCRRHFNEAPRGKWTPEQDELLSAAFAERPNRWVFVSERVGRLPEDCRDRWRNFLSLGDSRHTDVWTRDEELTLCKAIRDSIVAARQRHGDIPPEKEDQHISWSVVVQKMGGLRNRLQCTNKWKKIRNRAVTSSQGPDVETGQDKRLEKAASKKRFKNLAFGDLHAMMKEIQYACFIGRVEHGPTFWGVVTKMHPSSPYTTADRKHAYRQLKELIEDSGDFPENVALIIEAIETKFTEKMQVRNLHEDPKNRRGNAPRTAAANNYPSAVRVHDSDDEGSAEPATAGADDKRTTPGDYASQDGEREREASAQSEVDGTPVAPHQHELDREQQGPNSPHISESEYEDAE